MAELFGLPERFRSRGDGGGVIEESASGATLCALLAERWRAAGDGHFDRLRAYTSNPAHSSIEQAGRISGLRPGQDSVIDVDAATGRASCHESRCSYAKVSVDIADTAKKK